MARYVDLAAIFARSSEERPACSHIDLSLHQSSDHAPSLCPRSAQDGQRDAALVCDGGARDDSDSVAPSARNYRASTLKVRRFLLQLGMSSVETVPDSRGHFGRYGGM